MAQTLKFGKGTWATKTGSSMAYNDQSGNYKPLPFNVERDSIATRVNKEGLIEVVGKDKLRIDYTDSAKGVALLENSSTNLVTYSQNFSEWSQTRTSNTDNEIISPDGTLNASLITEDATLNTKFTFLNLSTTTNEHTLSFFAKYKGRYLQVLFGTSDTSGDVYINFDLQNGTFNNNGVSNPSIQDFGNGWYNISLSITPIVTSDFGVLFSLIPSLTSSRLTSYQGDGTSGVYLYGAMLEQNSFATSYIPTSGSTVQRQADVVNGSGNSEVFNDSEGVLFADIASNSDTTTAYNSIGIGSNSSNNRISIGFDASSNLYVFKRTTSQWLSNTSNDIKLYNKIAISYNTNDNHFWLNGFKIDSDTTIGDLSTKPKELGFEATFGGNNFYGKTKEIGYYDATLTDSELEYLTSYRSLNELVTELNLNTL